VAVASAASAVLASRYSSMLKPAVTRSVCNRRVRTFDVGERRAWANIGQVPLPGGAERQSACPQFDVVFVRNLHILTQDPPKYVCMQKQLVSHPCKDLGWTACRESFIAAMV
jgi:hypothetical protein